MTAIAAPNKHILPVEIATSIIKNYDSTLNIVDANTQVYGTTLDGKGKVQYRNGNHYEGEFNNGLFHGNGTFYWANDIKYTGTFVNNSITGSGRYDWPDGSWYEGEVKNGLRNGYGKFATSDEDCVYEGEWKDGLKHGKGCMTFKSGTKYEGTFERGQKHGYGKMSYPSGNYYEGYWALDNKEGKGTMFWVTSSEKYTGDWAGNKQEGWGEHIWLESKTEEKFLRNRYEGEWRDGKRNGIGVFYYSNGSKYQGEWVDNLKEGFAIFTYEDGRVFKGQFRSDKMVQPENEKKIQERWDELEGPKTQETQNKTPHQSPDKKHRASVNSLAPLKPVTPQTQKFSRPSQMTPSSTKHDVSRSKEIEVNLYNKIVDVSDLFADEEDEVLAQTEMREINKLLLRYHIKLKAWYRHYVEKQPAFPEESFSLALKMFWKMLRDARILSPSITISSFNRLFLQGPKNTFDLHTSLGDLKKIIFPAKSSFVETMSEMERLGAGLHLEKIPQDEMFIQQRKIDVNDENRIMLFRHFVDGLVRVAYLKYGGTTNLTKNLEQVLLKIDSGIEVKKKYRYQVEEEKILVKARGVTVALKARLEKAFHAAPSKRQSLLFDTFDYTMTVQEIVELFEKCEIIQSSLSERDAILHAAERTYDPEILAIPIEGIKEKPLVSLSENEKIKRIGDLLASEVIFLEFYDIFLLKLFLKDGHNLKEEEISERADLALSKIEAYYKQESEDFEDATHTGPKILWPYSEKDYKYDHLNVEKEKREKELVIHRQKKAEKEDEERETGLMEKEDFDIYSNQAIIKQSSHSHQHFSNPESRVDVESYDDF